jgi:hypothetical protein
MRGTEVVRRRSIAVARLAVAILVAAVVVVTVASVSDATTTPLTVDARAYDPGASTLISTRAGSNLLRVIIRQVIIETAGVRLGPVAHYGVAAKAATALPDDIARTFKGGEYAVRTLDEDLVLYRRWGGKAGELGGYWSRTNYVRAGNARRYSGLPPTNTAQNVATIRVPAGTRIYEGRAAAHAPWGAAGGGNQVVFEPGFTIPRSWLAP